MGTNRIKKGPERGLSALRLELKECATGRLESIKALVKIGGFRIKIRKPARQLPNIRNKARISPENVQNGIRAACGCIQLTFFDKVVGNVNKHGKHWKAITAVMLNPARSLRRAFSGPDST